MLNLNELDNDKFSTKREGNLDPERELPADEFRLDPVTEPLPSRFPVVEKEERDPDEMFD